MNAKQDTLVILSPGFPADEDDCTCLPERQVFVRNLKRVNPHLRIVVISFQYPYFKALYKWHGVDVYSVGGRNKGGIRRLYTWMKVWKILYKIKRENKIVGLLSLWLGEAASIGKWYAKRHRLKHYCWLLGQDAKPSNRYQRITNLRGSELIALSDFLAFEFYKNYGIKPAHIIPPGLDETLFDKNAGERTINILGTGSLIPLKQYELLIEVVKEIAVCLPNVSAILCGAGPEEKKLQSLINQHDLQNNITLLNEIPHREVLKLMQRSKLFLHPSGYEGFGAVCQEALFAGAHVISFCQPMQKEIPHWHIVKSKTEMVALSLRLLTANETDHSSVNPFPIDNTVQQTMTLFR